MDSKHSSTKENLDSIKQDIENLFKAIDHITITTEELHALSNELTKEH